MAERKFIARHILDYCARNNISQKELGAQLGIKQQSINNWVREKTEPSFENLIKLQILTGVIDTTGKKMILTPYYLYYDLETDGVELTDLKPSKQRAKILVKYENEEEMLKLIYEDYFIIYNLYQFTYEDYECVREPFLKWRKKNKVSAKEWFESKKCCAPKFYDLALREDDWLKQKITKKVYNLTGKTL